MVGKKGSKGTESTQKDTGPVTQPDKPDDDSVSSGDTEAYKSYHDLDKEIDNDFVLKTIPGIKGFKKLKRFENTNDNIQNLNIVEKIICYVIKGLDSSFANRRSEKKDSYFRSMSTMAVKPIALAVINEDSMINPVIITVAIQEVNIVGAWYLLNDGDPSAKDLDQLSKKAALYKSLAYPKVEDKPSTSAVLPKLSGDGTAWQSWKMDAMGILGQHGLLDVVTDQDYAESHPRSSAVVFGMLRSACSNMVGHNVTYFLSDNSSVVPKCGFTAWKIIASQFEDEMFIDFHVDDTNSQLNDLRYKKNGNIVAFNMKFLASKNAMQALVATADSTGANIGHYPYYKLDEKQWVEKYKQKLNGTDYAKYLDAAKDNYGNDLNKFMLYIRKTSLSENRPFKVKKRSPPQSDGESDDEHSSSPPKKARFGDKDSGESKQKPDDGKANAYRMLQQDDNLDEDAKKQMKALLDKAYQGKKPGKTHKKKWNNKGKKGGK